ncbi:hypothetical protein GCM10023074_19440 [Microbispora amethystogenes]|uniref:Transposase n=1 Tax=Microbispora amethystogenes TaxID=1427754 RepID=A0ABQ4FM16_9ACTN|nr:hypothetical protein Mam01_59860 [Microbispora amethystogenes]
MPITAARFPDRSVFSPAVYRGVPIARPPAALHGQVAFKRGRLTENTQLLALIHALDKLDNTCSGLRRISECDRPARRSENDLAWALTGAVPGLALLPSFRIC